MKSAGHLLMKLTKKFMEISVLKKLIFSYLILVILLVSVIGVTSFRISSTNYNQQVGNLNTRLLEQYANMVTDNVINSVYRLKMDLCLNINHNTDIEGLFTNPYDSGKILTLYNELNTIVSTSDELVEAIHIYSRENDFILSSTLGLKYNNELNQQYWPNMIWVQQVESLPANSLWVSTREVSYTTSNSVDVITYIATYPANMSFADAQGFIAIDIKESCLRSILGKISLNGNEQLFLMDREGNLITHSDYHRVPATIYDLGYESLDPFQASGTNRMISVGGVRSILMLHEMGNGWKLVSTTSVDDFYAVTRRIAVNTVLILAVAVILGGILARLFAFKLYFPLKQIIMRIQSLLSQADVENKIGDNEYAIIDSALSKFNSKILSLSKNWEDNLPSLKKNLLHSIISKTLESKQAFEKNMQLMGKTRYTGMYNILLIHIIGSDKAGSGMENHNLVNEALIGFTEGLSNDATVFIAGEITPQCIAVLIISANTQLRSAFEQIITYTDRKLMVNADLSIGSWQTSPMCCDVSYQEAVDVYRYQFFHPHRNFFDTADFSFSQQDGERYDHDLNKLYAQFSKHLKTGDITQVQEIISDFVNVLIRSGQTHDDKKKRLTDMANVLLEYSREYGIGAEESALRIRYPVEGITDIYEYEAWLLQAVSHVMELKKGYEDRKLDNIIDNIKRYIQNNLSEDLSLTRLSEYTTLSNSYLSHVFKESTGINVVDYITEQRMLRAKSLLQNSRVNIGSVARMVGFYTPHYFTKKFKQYYGTTPHQYRIDSAHR